MTIPHGYCRCGCGKRTKLAKRSRPYLGHVKDEPLPYLLGHNSPAAKKRLSERRATEARERHPARFWAKVRKTDGCWEWTGYRSHGYGRYSLGGRDGMEHPAHRVAYELVKGSIPAGMVIDHLCRNRGCVNPDHLEAVTQATNILRGEGTSAVNALKTHCEHGHPFDEFNTYIRPNGSRKCRECAHLYHRVWRYVNK